MRIEKLYGRHKGEPIYIVGTGPSMRVFPTQALKGKTCIGLNQAWRYCPLTYTISVHPELLTEYLDTPNRNKTQWIVKHKPPLNLLLDDPEHYVFHTSEDDMSLFKQDKPDTLFIGRGVQQTAMHMAALMGASELRLVGIDMTDLGGEHHGHAQHVRFHGVPPDIVYKEYRVYTAKVRKAITDRWKIPVLTLSPLLGADHGTEDYERLCAEQGLPKLPPPQDTSPYKRPIPKL